MLSKIPLFLENKPRSPSAIIILKVRFLALVVISAERLEVNVSCPTEYVLFCLYKALLEARLDLISLVRGRISCFNGQILDKFSARSTLYNAD